MDEKTRKHFGEPSFGSKLTPVINECADAILEHYEMFKGEKPNYKDGALRSAAIIFGDTIMDKMWELQEKENIKFENRVKMSKHLQKSLNKLVVEMTNIDISNR